MHIQSLTLYNFRNFGRVDEIEFPEAPLLIAVAPNATGKTNFIEAIVMLLRGKSFRSHHEDCVQWGEDSFVLQGTIQHLDATSRLAIQYHIPSRKLRIEENNIPVSPVTFYAHYPFVLFLPEDTFLFTHGPAVRRNFLNTTLASSSQYISSVVQYYRALRQRNAALKTARSVEDIDAWTELLTIHASAVWAARKAFVLYIENHIEALWADIFGEKLSFDVQLIPGASDVGAYSQLLHEAWEYERKYKYTLYGPHRDDLRVFANGRSVASAFSRGQLRCLAIVLKIAAWHYMKQISRQRPIILFDEALSELDAEHQRSLLEHLPKTQMVLSSTSIPSEVKRKERVHMLDLRTIIQESNVRSEEVIDQKSVAVKEEKERSQVVLHS